MNTSPYNLYGADYRPPTPHELREYLRVHRLVVSDMARLVGVTSRTARRWCADEGAKVIPYSAWRLMLERHDAELAGTHELSPSAETVPGFILDSHVYGDPDNAGDTKKANAP